MDMEHYELEEGHDKLHFEFFSDGPRGKIRKVIRYQQIWPLHGNVFNISFGDWNTEGNYSDDEIISNNNDRNKVLATVALSMILFNKKYPGNNIMIIGSTCSRTRLYQMAISKFQYQFAHLFEINGFFKEEWQLFKKGINYEAFLIKSKKL